MDSDHIYLAALSAVVSIEVYAQHNLTEATDEEIEKFFADVTAAFVKTSMEVLERVGNQEVLMELQCEILEMLSNNGEVS